MSPETPRARRWESAAAGAAWLLLAGLTFARGPLSFQGTLGQPLLSVLAAVLALWVAPGFVLWRWVVGGPWRHSPAWSFGLGLSWTLVLAAAGMAIGTSLDRLLLAIVAANGLLTAAFIFTRHPAASPPSEAEAGPGPSWWMVAAVAAVMARLLDLGTRRLHRLTYGSDEWVLMGAVRAFLEQPTVADPHEFDVCDLAIALVARLSRVEVFDVYRLHLPALLVLAGALAFLVLAEAALRDRGLAWMALALQGLFALSEMYPRGEGMGMAMLVRQVEDKFVALLVVLPLAQAAFLWAAVRGGGRRALALFAFLGVAATLLQPFAVPWLALTCGVTYVAALATGRLPRSRRLMIALAACTCAGLAMAWVLRALRPSPYFVLYDPSWPFNATLLQLSVRQVWILSLEKGWYMAHPWLLSHPLVIASLAGSLLLLARFRKSVEAQWLVLATWIPVLLTFNPLTAVALGWLVTPWRLYRLLWVMPVALVLARLLGGALSRAEAWLARRWPAAGRRLAAGPMALAALALIAVLLAPRMAESARALRARNRVLVKPGEKEFLHELSALAQQGLRGTVLAPEGLSVRLPTWTARLQPLCGILAIRGGDADLLRRCAAFQEGSMAQPEALALLREHDVRYVITEETTAVDAALRARPTSFRPLLRAGELALYEWRPLGWSEEPR